MSEVNLLLFGCAVSFIALAGAYVYLRECFTMSERPVRRQPVQVRNLRERLRDVA